VATVHGALGSIIIGMDRREFVLHMQKPQSLRRKLPVAIPDAAAAPWSSAAILRPQ
jgi:hypothetical protein